MHELSQTWYIAFIGGSGTTLETSRHLSKLFKPVNFSLLNVFSLFFGITFKETRIKWKNHTVYWQKWVTWLKFLEYFIKGGLFSVIFQSLIVYAVHFRVTEPVAYPSMHWVEGKTTPRTCSLKSLLWQADKLLALLNLISVTLREETHSSCVFFHQRNFLVGAFIFLFSLVFWVVDIPYCKETLPLFSVKTR